MNPSIEEKGLWKRNAKKNLSALLWIKKKTTGNNPYWTTDEWFFISFYVTFDGLMIAVGWCGLQQVLLGEMWMSYSCVCWGLLKNNIWKPRVSLIYFKTPHPCFAPALELKWTELMNCQVMRGGEPSIVKLFSTSSPRFPHRCFLLHSFRHVKQ